MWDGVDGHSAIHWVLGPASCIIMAEAVCSRAPEMSVKGQTRWSGRQG